MTILLALYSLSPLPALRKHNPRYLGLRPVKQLRASSRFVNPKSQCHHGQEAGMLFRRFIVLAATEGSTKASQSDDKIPSWARPESDEPPPWARDEGNGSSSQQTFEIPFYAYLLASAVTAIAAVGSIFEYVNQKPVFGVLNSDSMFYAPLLGFFTFTGIPTSAFLWFKSVQVANKESEEQDRRDGYR